MQLAPRFTQPEGWQWSRIEPRDEQFLRIGHICAHNPRAVVIIFTGLSEFGEKYFEVARDLLKRDYSVVTVDWRGQGLSWRHLSDAAKRHHDDFDLDGDDGAAIIAHLDTMPGFAGLPKILLAHSMGGHIGLRMLHKNPQIVQCAVMTAPLMGISLPYDSELWARLLARFLCKFGWGECYAPGNNPKRPITFEERMRMLTTDPDRRDMQKFWRDTRADLQTGGLTFGWVHTALSSTLFTRNPLWLRNITTPMLMLLSGKDVIVSNTAIRTGAKALHDARLVEIPDALHEIMMERDELRDIFWAEFDAFVAKQLKAE